MGKAVGQFLVEYSKTVVELDARLEVAAIEAFGAYDPASFEDGFQPPKDTVDVECWHCGDKYRSNEMLLRYRPRMQHAMVQMLGEGAPALSPMWWCKNPECDGGGFGHDIHKIRKSRKRAA